MKRNHLLIILILIFAFFTRFLRLSHPPAYIYDEVYHAFTASSYAENDPKGYEWWHSSPIKGTAYEWLHPPIAKLFMALGILAFGNNSFGWRFFPAVFGVLVIYLLYLVGKKIFNEKVGLWAGFLGACDGMFLVMSRIAMNDIFLTAFILLTVYYLWNWRQNRSGKSLLLSFIFTGLAMSTKWSGVFLYPIIFFVLIEQLFGNKKNKFKKALKEFFLITSCCFLITISIYILSYGQWWFQGHTWKQFGELHKQIWWYQTNLKATHNYQSKAYTWPLMLRPVWFWVKYDKNKIANIYNLGNPIIWWSGVLVLPYAVWEVIKRLKKKLAFAVFCYFIFWLPWVFSPRIMFLHHYMPAIPFLCLIIGWFLNKIQNWKIKGKLLVTCYLLLVTLTFFFFYPLYVGILIPEDLFKYFFWLSSWK